MGDSISTQYNKNAVEIEITSEDVGIELTAYVTYYDIDTVIGGYRIVPDDIGKEITFIPTVNDVGKQVGKARNYNTTVDKVWWQYVEEYFDCKVNPVSWSGSSLSSHESDKDKYQTSYGWHEAQIRKLGQRISGTMERIAPDIVIIYRGCNDMTHAPYAILTKDYFDSPNWLYPTSDIVDYNGKEKAGYKEAMALTIKRIRRAYPEARIVLCTQNNFKRLECNEFPTRNGMYNLPQMNKSIRECADFFGCHTIDFDKDGITWDNCYSSGYITDSETIPTHPNNKGHLLMGKRAIYDLKSVISTRC